MLLKKRNKRELVELCNHSKTTYRFELLRHHRPRFNIFGKNQSSREKVVIQSYVRNVRLKPWTNFYWSNSNIPNRAWLWSLALILSKKLAASFPLLLQLKLCLIPEQLKPTITVKRTWLQFKYNFFPCLLIMPQTGFLFCFFVS